MLVDKKLSRRKHEMQFRFGTRGTKTYLYALHLGLRRNIITALVEDRQKLSPTLFEPSHNQVLTLLLNFMAHYHS